MNQLRQSLKPLTIFVLTCLFGVSMAAAPGGELASNHPYAMQKPLKEARIFGEGIISTKT